MTGNAGRGRWFQPEETDPEASVRLFLFPFAGGNAAMYQKWCDLLPAAVAAQAVQLPGRMDRRFETAFTEMSPLVDAMCEAFVAELDHRPYAVFGHSMGLTEVKQRLDALLGRAISANSLFNQPTMATRAIRMALTNAGLRPKQIDHVNAHGTSTPLNDVTEAKVLRRIFGQRPAVTSIKGVTGDPLGAAGPIEAACTVLAVQHGVVPPTANLDGQDPEIDVDVAVKKPRTMPIQAAISNSFGFGGQMRCLW